VALINRKTPEEKAAEKAERERRQAEAARRAREEAFWASPQGSGHRRKERRGAHSKPATMSSNTRST
jgi:hypothetical protein